VSRLEQQLRFLVELDKAKTVFRQSYLTDGSRKENDGEHMWHLALFVLVLAEHAAEPIDLGKVLQMVLVHDIVEIDAGDTYIYDEVAKATQAARESAAADRLYGLLPPDQGAQLRAVWEEFEARETAESRFAAAVDRLQPLLLNLATEGRAWREHGMTADRVRQVNEKIALGSPALWDHVRRLLDDAVDKGYLPEP
jgi:putative hydrolases of HD superfamily